MPGAACPTLPLQQPLVRHRLVSLPGQAWISLKGGFPAGGELGANSSMETGDWEPHRSSPSVGVLSSWAGCPAHILCAPSRTWDVSPPWQGHVRTTCLSGLQKGPESSLVANHCLHGGHGDMVRLASSMGSSTAMAQGLLWAAA